MIKLTTNKRGKHLKKMFVRLITMCFTLLLGAFEVYGQDAHAVLVPNPQSTLNPEACGDPFEYEVHIKHGTSAHSNAKFEINIPQHFGYVNGSLTATGGTTSNLTHNGNVLKLDLNIPAASGTDPKVVIKFKLNTFCGAIATTGEGATKPKLTYKLTNAGQTNEQLGQSNDINVLFAALQTTASPATVDIPAGDITERTITIKNNGNGKIQNFKVTVNLGADLEFVSDDTSEATAAGWTVNKNGNAYEFSGKKLEVGATVSFKHSVKLKGCTNYTSSYVATYGCGTDASCQYSTINQATASPKISLDRTKAPNIVITALKDDGTPVVRADKPGALCLDQEITHLWKVENKGTAAATDLEMAIYTPSDGNQSGATYLITGAGSFEWATDMNFTTPKVLTLSDFATWGNSIGTAFGTSDKYRHLKAKVNEPIAKGQTIYVRFKTKNNNYLPTTNCATKAGIFNFGQINTAYTYKNGNVCSANLKLSKSQTVMQTSQSFYFDGSNVASLMIEHHTAAQPKIYKGSFLLKYFNFGEGGGQLKPGDYFDLILQLAPSMTLVPNSIKVLRIDDVLFTPTLIPDDANKTYKLRFEFSKKIINTSSSDNWTGQFNNPTSYLNFEATYDCGGGTTAAEAWYKVQMEAKRAGSCATSPAFQTKCVKVDLTPVGCTQGCGDGFTRGIAKVERHADDYGYKSTDPDSRGLAVYPLEKVNAQTAGVKASSFHTNDRIWVSQTGKVILQNINWKKGVITFAMPTGLYADGSSNQSIIKGGKVELTRAGTTYKVENLPVNITGNQVTFEFNADIFTAQGINTFEKDDELEAFVLLQPNNGSRANEGHKVFDTDFYLVDNNDKQHRCSPNGKANSLFVVSRFNYGIEGAGPQSSRELTNCESNLAMVGESSTAIRPVPELANQIGAKAYFRMNIYVFGSGSYNAAFPKENRRFLTPQKLVAEVPQGLDLLGFYVQLSGTGGSNYAYYRWEVPNGAVSGQTYEMPLQEVLEKILKERYKGHPNFVQDMTKPVDIDEGFWMRFTPVVRKNCYSGATEDLTTYVVLDGTGQTHYESNAASETVYNNHTGIQTPPRTITYAVDGGKLETSVVHTQIPVNSDEVKWVIKVANNSNFSTIDKLWLGSKQFAVSSVQEATDATGQNLTGTVLPNNGGVFQLGQLAKSSTRYFVVTARLATCQVEDKTLLLGALCGDYPTDINTIDESLPCVKSLNARYERKEASFQVQIKKQPEANFKPKLCEQIEYDVEINNNSGEGLAKEISLKIPLGLNQGLEFVQGSALISEIYNSGNHDTNVTWSDANVTTEAEKIIIRLDGKELLPGQKIRVRFKVQTTNDCRFASHQKIRFIPEGKNFCGSDIGPEVSVYSNNLIISGDNTNNPVVDIEQSDAQVTFAQAGATGNVKGKYALKIKNSGALITTDDVIKAGAKLAVKLPMGWVFDNEQDVASNSNNKLEFVIKEGDFYVYNLKTDIQKDESLVVTQVDIHATTLVNCTDTQKVLTQLYYLIENFDSACGAGAPPCSLRKMIKERETDLLINTAPKAILKTGANTEFCGVKTVADLSNLIEQNADLAWYTTATGGTALASTHQITTTTYYVALKDALTGCESAERLAVSVTIKEQSERGYISKVEDAFCNVTSVTVAQLKSYINNQGEDGEIKIYEIDPVTQVPTTLKTDADQLTAGQMYAYTRTQAGKCESVYNHITLTIGKSATPAALTETLCGAISVDNLKAKFVVPVGATIKVYLGSSEVTSGDLMAGNYQVSVVENGKCESNKQNVIIHTSADVPTFTIVNKDCTTLGSVTISNYNGINTYEFSDTALTMDDTTGKITGFVYGQAYTVTVTAAGGCQAQATFTVNDTCVIDAVDDIFSPVSGTVGGEAGNVLSDNGNGKDKLGSEDATTSNVQISVVTHAGTGNVPQLERTTGKVTVPVGTPAGTYTIVYKICDSNNLVNCDTATATVIVSTIEANNDDMSGSPVNGAVGNPNVVNVLTNDIFDGVPNIPISNVKLTVISQATPIGSTTNVPTLDSATGDVSVPTGTPAGTYTITYEICISGTTICDRAKVTVVVTAQDIVAQDDTFAPIAGVTGGRAGNVLSDNGKGADMLGGNPVTGTDVTISEVTPATPINGGNVPSLNIATGEVTVPANTPAGTYSIVYQICEVLNPMNCDTATVTVVVTAQPIDAKDDTFASVLGAVGGRAGNVLSDNGNGADMLGSNPATVANVTISEVTPATPIGTSTNVPSLNIATGEVTVPASTPAGTYSIVYQICEKLNPSNCDTATATVVVTAQDIVAQDDTFTSIAGVTGGTAGNVLSDNGKGADMLGVNPATVTDVTISEVTPATPINGGNVPSLNIATGEVTVPANTPAGTYSIVYQICEKLNPSNCDTATATVVVTAQLIKAQDDTFAPIVGVTGGTAGNVLSDNGKGADMLGGNPATVTDVTISVVTPATPINGGNVPSLNKGTGEVTVPANTPAGTYSIVYQICEKLNPSNCDTATATVVVSPADLEAVPDDFSATPIGGTDGGKTSSVLTNDKLNGTPLNPSDVTLTWGTIPSGFTPNADGTITVVPNTPAGTYTLTYTICEVLNPSNCKTTTVTVLVTASPIVANDDDYTMYPIYTTVGGTVSASVLVNDTIEGVEATLATVTISNPTTPNTNINIDPASGMVVVLPNTPVGTYTLTYTICERGNPTNCSNQANVTVVVLDVPKASDDSATTEINTPVVVNILENDQNIPAIGKVSVVSSPSQGSVQVNDGGTPNDPSDDTVTYTPNLGFVGVDSFVYELCDAAGNCASATVTIEVVAGGDITPYNAISINDDGSNDVFYIKGIEGYPNNTVRIYNRWGVKVFEAHGYNNTTKAFRGISNGRVTVDVDKKLPQGTYYYVIEYVDKNNQTKRKGSWLYIKR
ncbi:gliding motility-associated C-terminal domain-containing protein [Capnocytophaga canimorsus]|uniref:T9SS type B sorting domain-containing protein n=1 Tax=Capnocytophaga canimorsus TaxID=28188 RepID=UPI00385B5E8A